MVLSKRNYSLAFTVLLIYTSTNTQSAQASQGDSLLKLIVISSIISSVEKVFIEPVFGPYILKWAENFHHPKILRGESSLVYLFRDKLRVCNRERFDYLPEIIQFHACRERPMHMDLNQLVYPPETKNEIDGFVKTLHYLIAEQRNLPNLLLYGRQGTGKTVLAEAIAHHFGFNFQPLSGSEIKKNPNEAIDSLYRAIQWAKRDGRYDNRPVLIFIDEMEAFMRKREDILMGLDYDLLSEFLALVNNSTSPRFMVVAATNLPGDTEIDQAILARFEWVINIQDPGEKEIKKLLKLYLKDEAKRNNFDHTRLLTNENLAHWVKLSQGFSARDITISISKAFATSKGKPNESTISASIKKTKEKYLIKTKNNHPEPRSDQ